VTDVPYPPAPARRALPCRGRWSFASDGPLAFLQEARQLASFRMKAFRLRFD
jgi:acetoacetate decarboxylase